MQPLSLIGWDVEDNLATLCSVCHGRIHRRAERPARF